jgi:hypothetical protein
MEPGKRFLVKIHSTHGKTIELESKDGRVPIPASPWRALLGQNANQPLFIDIQSTSAAGTQTHFQTVTNTIAPYPVDGWLVYRLIKPLYNVYRNVGIYQRRLSDFEETEVLHGRNYEDGCVNCHTFCRNRPEPMSIHIRSSAKGMPMLYASHGEVTRVNKTAGYMSWHPNGKILAYSENKLSMFFHTTGESRDVFDAASDLGIYDVVANTVSNPAPISKPDRLETWPSWSPDGKYLYFCAANKQPIKRFKEILYDLERVSYDETNKTWGVVETLVSSKISGLSAAQPKVAPDGHSVVFTLCRYGNFPIYQPNSDLYELNLENRQWRRLDIIDSDQADSWHCWSSNGRWMVFSSKRRDGLLARPHFTYIDERGQFHKPFILPQKDPDFYDAFIKTYNVPELISEPIPFSQRQFLEAVNDPKNIVNPQSIGPAQKKDSTDQPQMNRAE